MNKPISTESSPALNNTVSKNEIHGITEVINEANTKSNYVFENVPEDRNTTLIILNGDASVQVLKEIKVAAQRKLQPLEGKENKFDRNNLKYQLDSAARRKIVGAQTTDSG